MNDMNNFLGFKTLEKNTKMHLLLQYNNKEHPAVILCGEDIEEETILFNSFKPVNCKHCLKILKLMNQ